MTRPIYIIPDIHGQMAMLDQALARIAAEAGGDACTIFLGDLVDRGPDSRGVIQTLIDGTEAGRDWVVLRGNHDQIFNRVLTGREPAENQWISENMGGRQTLASYGIDADAHGVWPEIADSIPKSHRVFLAGLPYSFETDELFFCHAGIRPGVPLTEQDPDDLMWIREPFLSDSRDHGKLVVHGHTPVNRPRHYGNRVNLDGGAGWGRPLFTAVFEGRDAWLLTDEGREALSPP